MSDNESPTNGWRRANVNVRLSALRRANLLELCGDPARITPTAAIDLAIDLAKQARARDLDEENEPGPSSAHASMSCDAHDTLLAIAREIRMDAAASRELMSDVATRTKELRDVIVEAASDREISEGDGSNSNIDSSSNEDYAAPSLPLRSWLDQQAQSAPATALFARASWIGSRRSAPGRVRVELNIQRHSRGENQSPATLGPINLAHVDLPHRAESPMRLEQPDAFYLQCQQDANGSWKVAARSVAQDGKLAPVTAAFILR